MPFGLRGEVSYPVLPWIGIMALGYGLGYVFLEPAARRQRQLKLLGLASIALFLLLRGTNLYGDPSLWSAQGDGVMTALSVLNVTKYPPSLLYALVTLGSALLLLSGVKVRAKRNRSRHGKLSQKLFAMVNQINADSGNPPQESNFQRLG